MLLASAGVAEIDMVLAAIIGTLDTAFGARVRGYYLVGSYAIGCPVWTSDVDLVALFDDLATAAEQRRFGELIAPIRARSRWPLDITPINEADLRRDGASRFKFASRLLYGEDVRDRLPLRPIENYIRSEMSGAFTMLTRIHGTPASLSEPLGAPDPNDDYLGYASRQLKLPDGTRRRCTKDLVLANVSVGTALIALKARQYTHHKSQLVANYRLVNDEWTPLVATVYQRCRDEWAYLLPDAPDDQRLLRELCVQELAFENHFLTRCRLFLHDQAQSNDLVARAWALGRLGALAASPT